MPIYLKQSTASQEIPLGVFVDETDGKTAEIALTIANTDIKIWKSGATTLANKNSGGATHISAGIYYATLDATDTDTLGPLVAFVHVSGALPIRVEACVMAANVYDSLIGGGDVLDVSTTQFNGSSVVQSGGRPEVNTTHIAGSSVSTSTAQIGVNVVNAGGTAWASGSITSSVLADDAITAAKINTGALTADAFAADALVAATFATDAITADALATDAAQEIASAVMTPAISTWEGTAQKTSLAAAAAAAVHLTDVNNSTGDIDIYKSDSVTVWYTRDATTATGRDPLDSLGKAT